MKKILYTILTAAAVLLGNCFFSNGTLEATVETSTPVVTATLPAPSATSPALSEATVEMISTPNNKDGVWITNVGRLSLKQDIHGSAEITATMEGYGELGRQDVLQGTLHGDTAILNSQMLGDLNIIFSGDTFKTATAAGLPSAESVPAYRMNFPPAAALAENGFWLPIVFSWQQFCGFETNGRKCLRRFL